MPLHEWFPLNEKGRDFIVGDIHGCLDLFLDKLKEIDFDFEKDRMFSVGDLVDRGPDNLDCLKLIKSDWFHAVRGNHEDMLIGCVLHNSWSWDNWMANGGNWVNAEDINEVKMMAEEAEKLPYSITVATKKGNVGICHAQPPSVRWSDAQNPTELDLTYMLWARNWLQMEDIDVEGVYETYHGHTIMPDFTPYKMENVNFIDTGAFHSGILTVVEL